MKKLWIYYWKKNRIVVLYLIGVLLFIVALLFGFMLGNTRISFTEMIEAAKSGFNNSSTGRIFIYVRLSRTIASIVCGAALAVAGVLIQGVLANRLASPSVIGVNAGAGLAVTVCSALGLYSGWTVSVFAFLGAFLTVMAVSLVSRKWGASRGTVILIGVAVNSLLGAVSDSIVTFIPEVGIISNDFKVGEFASVTYERLIPAAILILITIFVSTTLSNELDVLTLGEETARSLGMNASVMRIVFLALAALLAGCAVSLAGLLSFVGLIIPHIIRRMVGSKSIHLLGLSTLYGSSFVCICDTIARTAFSPYEIPVGIIMAFLGAPFFVFILVKGKGGHRSD